MIRKLLLLSIISIGFIGSSYAQIGTGTLSGTITDQATGETVPFANIVVMKAGQQVTGASTDFESQPSS